MTAPPSFSFGEYPGYTSSARQPFKLGFLSEPADYGSRFGNEVSPIEEGTCDVVSDPRTSPQKNSETYTALPDSTVMRDKRIAEQR